MNKKGEGGPWYSFGNIVLYLVIFGLVFLLIIYFLAGDLFKSILPKVFDLF